MMQIGTDIVEIKRVPLKESFLSGVLSGDERKLYEESPDKASFLAGHYAAKEAFLKALGTGLSGAKLTAIEVLYEEGGRPYIRYKGSRYSVSISHDGGLAIAMALVEQ